MGDSHRRRRGFLPTRQSHGTRRLPTLQKPVYDDGVNQWVEEPDGTRVYGVWYVPREECDTPIVVGEGLRDDF